MKNIIFITCFTLVFVLITSCGSPGINGELTTDVRDAFYTFDNIRDFRTFIGGGLWWLLGDPLFNPDSPNNGISSLKKMVET